MSAIKLALAQLHFTVFLAGFTGLFGKWVQLSEIPLVWYRVFFAVLTLYPLILLAGRGRADAAKPLPVAMLVVVGGLQVLQWVLFYASIKLSTVSVALVCISTGGFFTALLSPAFLGTKYSPREFVYSGITIAGIALIFHFDIQYRLGIVIGVIASAVGAFFVILNKKHGTSHDPARVLFIELAGGLVLLTLVLPLYCLASPGAALVPGASDLALLFILGFVLTTVLYIIQLQALRHVSAFTLNLSLNLQPIYSIVLAALFLGEARDFTPSFYFGLGLLVLSIGLQTLDVLKNRAAGLGVAVPPSSA